MFTRVTFYLAFLVAISFVVVGNVLACVFHSLEKNCLLFHKGCEVIFIEWMLDSKIYSNFCVSIVNTNL